MFHPNDPSKYPMLITLLLVVSLIVLGYSHTH